jgi:hypothetical protein
MQKLPLSRTATQEPYHYATHDQVRFGVRFMSHDFQITCHQSVISQFNAEKLFSCIMDDLQQSSHFIGLRKSKVLLDAAHEADNIKAFRGVLHQLRKIQSAGKLSIHLELLEH